MAEDTGWTIESATPTWMGRYRTIYFLWRFAGGRRENYLTPSGRLKIWRSKAAAEKFLSGL